MGGKSANKPTARGRKTAAARAHRADGHTRQQLYIQARRRHIEGRSKMSKRQLENALASLIPSVGVGFENSAGFEVKVESKSASRHQYISFQSYLALFSGHDVDIPGQPRMTARIK